MNHTAKLGSVLQDLLVATLLLNSFVFCSSAQVGSPWHLRLWEYRKTHLILARSGAGTDYTINLTAYFGSGADSGTTVYLNSHCRTDFADVRFTDTTGTLLTYWLQSKTDGSYAVFWVKLSDDLSNNVLIYLYYGNPSAGSLSNFEDTFIFGELFDSPALDTEKWTSVDGNPTYTINPTEHYLEITDMDTYTNLSHGFHSRSFTFPSSWIVENAYSLAGLTLWHNSVDTVDIYSIMFCVHNDSIVYGSSYGIVANYIADSWAGDTDIIRNIWINSSLTWSSGKCPCPHPVVYQYRYWKDDGKISVVENGTVRVDEEPSDYTVDRVHIASMRYEWFPYGTNRIYAFKIRKFVSPEPQHSSWGEQESPASSIAMPYAYTGITIMSLAFAVGIGIGIVLGLQSQNYSQLIPFIITALGVTIVLFISLVLLSGFIGL